MNTHTNTLVIYFVIGLLTILPGIIVGQRVAINSDGTAPDSSALLDLKSTTSGLLVPRMTTAERAAIPQPAVGLMVYDTETNSFWCYAGSSWVEVLAGYVALLSDADNDTKVEVEKTADDDLIRFTTGGTEYFRMDSGRLEVLNTGGSVFLGDDAGKNDNLLNRQNVYVGFQSGRSNISGAANIGIGYQSLLSSPDGFWNTAVGYGALKSNLSAHGNTAFGFQSLNLNTTGQLNTAVGYRALESNESGTSNTAVGIKALFSNVDRSHLVAVGDSALFHNGLGVTNSFQATHNTALGSKALYSNTTGNDNTSTGFKSLYSNESGYRNSAFGHEALLMTESGKHNNAFGHRALNSNTEGSYNAAFGSSALYQNTTGENNTAVGNRPLNNNTTGSANVAIGEAALFGSTDRSFLVAVGDSALFNNGLDATESYHSEGNTAVGSKSLYSNTTGYYNTATGFQAMFLNSTGIWNSAYGYQALYANTTGSYNTAIGITALYQNSSGESNTATGWRALRFNDTGNNNIAFGSHALYSNTTGSSNSAIGILTLHSNQTGNANAVLGARADYYNQSGNNNTIIGYQAGHGTTLHSKSGNVFLGYKAGFYETGNNKLYIQNDSSSTPLIYGEFDSAFVRINGRVAVGDNNSTSPATGSIRWNEAIQDFEGYTGIEWKSLTYQGERWGSTIMENNLLTASDGMTGDKFGYSVAISGDYAIVGAYLHDIVPNGDEGKAYIYHRAGNSWTEQAILNASDGEPENYFGYNVSISGDYAIVGAIDHDTVGQAYIFHRFGSSWTEQAILNASDAATGDQFGTSVSISGDYAIVGAIGGGNIDQGKAYIFHRSGTTWSEEDILLASDGEEDDYFGDGVAISSDYAIVGASRHFTNGNEVEGKVYVFHRSGSDWLEESILTASDGNQGDQFGKSVSIFGDYVIIGAPDDWHPLGIPGQAYIFHRSGTNWTEQAILSASDGSGSLDHFGSSVSIYGDFAIVGARRTDDPGDDDEQGRAYIFHRSGSSWTEQVKLQASDGANPDLFGRSVSISGNYAIVGRPDGQVYIYRN